MKLRPFFHLFCCWDSRRQVLRRSCRPPWPTTIWACGAILGFLWRLPAKMELQWGCNRCRCRQSRDWIWFDISVANWVFVLPEPSRAIPYPCISVTIWFLLAVDCGGPHGDVEKPNKSSVFQDLKASYLGPSAERRDRMVTKMWGQKMWNIASGKLT